MLVPYTHENTEARRWPVLTTALVVLNVLCFVLELVATSAHGRTVEGARRELVAYWQAHPALATPAPLVELARERRLGDLRDGIVPPASAEEAVDPDAQAVLDGLAGHLVDAVHDDPLRTFGYVPQDGNILGLGTYAFLHGGVLHLLFNMWFMWLCACNLEDRWGRPTFLGMYLAGAVVSALVHGLVYPTSTIPLIGASGAIAGAMGAFLVLFATTRIRFFYWYFVRVGTFAAPAWVMLPLWLLQELLYGTLTGGADGTAHFAHVGGFVFGMAFAGVMRVTGLDARLDAASEKKVTTEQVPQILAAGGLIDEGRHAEAIAILERYVARTPESIDAFLELLRAATAVRDPRRMGLAYARLVDLYVRDGALDAAVDLHLEAEQMGCGPALADVRLRLGERLASRGDVERALPVYARIFAAGLADNAAAGAAVAYARLLLARRRTGEAERVLDAVEASRLPGFERDVAALRHEIGGAALSL